MKTQAIIPAAGMGLRLKASSPKPFIRLRGKPICVYALEMFQKSPLINSVIVVAHVRYLEKFRRIAQKYKLDKITKIVAGGEERHQSVCRGLEALDPDTDCVVIHDSARPLITTKIIDGAVKACFRHLAVTTAVPVKPTIKEVHPGGMTVKRTLKRSLLWETQTPQVFKKEIIVKAHRRSRDRHPTDDAGLVEAMGIKVKVIRGDYRNIKITTKEDLLLAAVLLGRRKGRADRCHRG
ncbi:MAG: 2-C-methyl-D-erythritol 4-phosphate cytidylyltransferase [Candidatus Omnitrophota bacterium]